MKTNQQKHTGAIIGIGIASALTFCMKGRRSNRRVTEFQHRYYAHRGLHKLPDVPENSMKAFDAAFHKGYGIEIDVHSLKDGEIAVFHDSKLERMCGVKGILEDLTSKEAKELHLLNTEERIPMLTELLEAHDYKEPFLIEVKTWKNNGKKTVEKVCEIMDQFPHIQYCIQSFDPRVLIWLKKHRPEIVRGQLSTDFIQERSELLTNLQTIILTYLLTNVASKPDFVSYNFHYRSHPAVKLSKSIWHIPVFNWTIRTKEDMVTAQMENHTVIFEGFEP